MNETNPQQAPAPKIVKITLFLVVGDRPRPRVGLRVQDQSRSQTRDTIDKVAIICVASVSATAGRILCFLEVLVVTAVAGAARSNAPIPASSI